MASLTVIVTAKNTADKLKYTFEGLVEQSIEDFDVVIVDYGCNEEAKAVIKEYCDSYVGFSACEKDCKNVPEARNAGVKYAKGELVWFIDGGDYISPDSVESVIKTADETKADIISPRYYMSGENEPYYDRWMDSLATVPSADRLDTALLNTLDYDGRVFRKKFFDLYSLSFPSVPVFYNASFLIDCLFCCDAKTAGVIGAVYDRRTGVYSDGFTAETLPSEKTLMLCIEIYERAFSLIREIIEAETGAFDGDEYSVQEILYVYFSVLTDRFYRYFWYIGDRELEIIRKKYEEISALLTKERRDKLNAEYKDLRFPQMYVTRKDAAEIPLFSIIADIRDVSDIKDFISSLYIQKFPFFELFIREDIKKYLPEEWRDTENIRAVPDKGFFEKARAESRGVSIVVKDCTPLDPRILSELSLTKAPRSVVQYMFTSKRKKYSAKTYLKNKGLAIH